jgi:aspartyl-tRNA(Asn)/glutamyl-tRNA(Gln) amidotransferase subunit A
MGRALSPENMVGLGAQRDALAAALGRALDVAPILALPTSAFPPPAITRARRTAGPALVLMRGLGAFTPLANLADVPAIAVPCGVDDRGRPLSIMFVAARGGEERLLALAAAVEATGLATRQI